MSEIFDYNLHVFRSPKLKSVVRDAIKFFIQTPVHKLPLTTKFIGGGVYALYYKGKYELYAKLSELNKEEYERPIYIGKAVPSGWRTGRVRSAIISDLYNRIREHAKSIEQVRDLHIDEFRCRFIILDKIEGDLVIPVEAELIRKFKPLWNTVIDGFGNHDPGSGRYNQAPSEWDVLHPGRKWVEKLTGEAPNLTNIIKKVGRTRFRSRLS